MVKSPLSINMSIKEVKISIEDGGEHIKLPVKLIYQSLEPKDFLNLLGKKLVLPYILMTIVSKENRKQIIFGDARKHSEFLQAIEEDIGEVKSWEHAQICVNENKKICLISFHYSSGKDDVKSTKQIDLIFGAINPELFYSSKVNIRYAGGNQFSYDLVSRKATKMEPWM